MALTPTTQYARSAVKQAQVAEQGAFKCPARHAPSIRALMPTWMPQTHGLRVIATAEPGCWVKCACRPMVAWEWNYTSAAELAYETWRQNAVAGISRSPPMRIAPDGNWRVLLEDCWKVVQGKAVYTRSMVRIRRTSASRVLPAIFGVDDRFDEGENMLPATECKWGIGWRIGKRHYFTAAGDALRLR